MNNLSEEQMKMLEPYMRNNMKHLKEMTRSILSKTGEEIYQIMMIFILQQMKLHGKQL